MQTLSLVYARPPPWSVEEYNDACFIVRDNDGQQLAYVYFEEEPGRRSAAKLLSKDEARGAAERANARPQEAAILGHSNQAAHGPGGGMNVESLAMLCCVTFAAHCESTDCVIPIVVRSSSKLVT